MRQVIIIHTDDPTTVNRINEEFRNLDDRQRREKHHLMLPMLATDERGAPDHAKRDVEYMVVINDDGSATIRKTA